MALGYVKPRDAVSRHCKRPQHVGSRETRPLHQQTVIIPESDVYRLIMRSQLKSAEAFEVWVTEEVLPTIRKTGSYSAKPTTPQLTDFRWIGDIPTMSHKQIAKVVDIRADNVKRTIERLADRLEDFNVTPMEEDTGIKPLKFITSMKLTV